jgi:hypothetical protein
VRHGRIRLTQSCQLLQTQFQRVLNPLPLPQRQCYRTMWT